MNSYLTYVVKRIFISLLVVLAIVMFAFIILHIMPGDPVRTMLGAEADEAMVQRTREELNLDKPLPVQFVLWMGDILKGDFGRSLILNVEISDLIKTRLPVTLSLTVPALAVSVILGIIIGVVCAAYRGSFLDQALTVLMTAMNGIPVFWIGIMLMYLFGVELKWLPLMGYVSPGENFTKYLLHAAMPVLIISFGPLSAIARQVRTNMLEVINQDYIRTAKAYNLSIGKIRYKYALKNSLIPVITLIGLQIRSVVGGSLLAEQVFSIAGIGRLILTSVMNRDYLVVQALVLVISVIVVFCNMILDLVYGLIDPRIRLEGGR